MRRRLPDDGRGDRSRRVDRPAQALRAHAASALEGCEDDVWIFQIAGDLDVSTGKKVLLAGGAVAKNVFWQIAGQATVHVSAHLEGVLLTKTGITFQTAASLHGRAYAQTAVAFDMNAITAP